MCRVHSLALFILVGCQICSLCMLLYWQHNGEVGQPSDGDGSRSYDSVHYGIYSVTMLMIMAGAYILDEQSRLQSFEHFMSLQDQNAILAENLLHWKVRNPPREMGPDSPQVWYEDSADSMGPSGSSLTMRGQHRAQAACMVMRQQQMERNQDQGFPKSSAQGGSDNQPGRSLGRRAAERAVRFFLEPRSGSGTPCRVNDREAAPTHRPKASAQANWSEGQSRASSRSQSRQEPMLALDLRDVVE
mmetsp:Transcript_61719/g.130254  ORF Transcript_61719/g.130254 Transcript_61719/m.130254 type:complete len:245 (-) Transcript_61719:52-786(-)